MMYDCNQFCAYTQNSLRLKRKLSKAESIVLAVSISVQQNAPCHWTSQYSRQTQNLSNLHRRIGYAGWVARSVPRCRCTTYRCGAPTILPV